MKILLHNTVYSGDNRLIVVNLDKEPELTKHSYGMKYFTFSGNVEGFFHLDITPSMPNRFVIYNNKRYEGIITEISSGSPDCHIIFTGKEVEA